MPVSIDHKLKQLSAADRNKIEARASELIAEEMTLRDLRKARKLTQVKLARSLGVSQDRISRIEQNGDLMLSTLRKTVEAMGGRLLLVAEFADSKPVVLTRMAEQEVAPPKAPKSKHRKQTAVR